MARVVRDSRIDSRSARARLSSRREPYWRKISRGRYLGYRRARDGGSWIARYRDQTGRQHFITLGSAADALEANGTSQLSFEQAQERARDWFAQMETGSVSGPHGRYTIADCMADYLDWLKQHRKSHRHLETYISAYILPRLGNIDTAKLTSTTLRKWHEDIAAEPPRLRTAKGQKQKYRIEDANAAEALRNHRLRAHRHLVTLRAALTRAWLDGRIARNDAWARVRPFPGVERQRSRFLNHDDARRLINACTPGLRQLVQLALLSGARYGELCALDVRDFQADAGTLFVRDSKSGKPRYIILNEEGRAFCRQLVMGRLPDEPLLVKNDGERWRRDHYFRPFKIAVVAANLEASFTFHELRHTWASLTIMAGAPLIVVAQNLGHRDTRMVESHYGHLADSYVAEMIRKTAPSYGIVGETVVVPLTR